MSKFILPSSVTRRDFLQGSAVAITAGLAPFEPLRAAAAATPYPPALTGLRGSHEGSFETAHALAREGKTFDHAGLSPEETYDLVIVGGGISGLAAAWFWRRKHGDQARILILENHDDFGGHAKRNEFTAPGGRFLLSYGGSESLEAPKANFSKEVQGLLKALGVEIARFEKAFDQELYSSLGMTSGVFFNAEDFGADKLVAADLDEDPDALLAEAPLSEAARKQIKAMASDPAPKAKGREDLSKISYRDHLARRWGLGDEALRFFENITQEYFALGAEAVPAEWALESGLPGFQGLDDEGEEGEDAPPEEPYIYHFPDGNASLARLLVRALIPGVLSGSTMEDATLARADYARLDLPANAVRLRLGSTVVHVKNLGAGVESAYMREGKLRKVAAKAAVLACYNMIIPHILPDLPEEQKAALAANVKAPIVYANVLLRDWRAMAESGVSEAYCPKAFFPLVMLDAPVAMGGYQNPRKPEEPIILRMVHIPTAPGMAQNDQFRMGRMALLETSFAQYEAKIVDQIGRMFGPFGLEPARDILAITVNRWPHGYSGMLNPLFDGPEAEAFPERARRPLGRVAIANADAGWNAFAHEAIDQAFRAVKELSA